MENALAGNGNSDPLLRIDRNIVNVGIIENNNEFGPVFKCAQIQAQGTDAAVAAAATASAESSCYQLAKGTIKNKTSHIEYQNHHPLFCTSFLFFKNKRRFKTNTLYLIFNFQFRNSFLYICI